MLNQVILYTFLIIGIIYTLHLGMYTIGANIFDTIQFIRSGKKKVGKTAKLPLVTVIIAAYNEEKSIKRSLQTVWASSYPRLEIIVVDDGSKDNTYSIVKTFIEDKLSNVTVNMQLRRMKDGSLRRIWKRGKYAKGRSLKLMTKPNGGKSSALNFALKAGVNGKYVMTLDADSLLDTYAIRNAVKYFDDENVAGVAANVRVLDSNSILGLLQKFEHLIGYRSKKFYSLTKSELIIGGVASTYRTSVLKKVGFYDTDTQTEDIGLSMKVTALGNKKHKLIYAPDVVAMTQGVQTFKALLKQRYRWKLGNLQNLIKFSSSFSVVNEEHSGMLTYYRVPMAFFSELLLLLEPLMLAYVIYLSYVSGTLYLFYGSYLVITLYVLFVVWPDEHFTNKTKLKMSAYAPIMYFVFYIMDLVQFVAVMRCLIHPKKMLLLVETDGRWVSPARKGFANETA
jgi:poly-beta-1,6-N-acetyl-D-glucosamine synthase